jgi:hypothetical protein
MKLTTFFSVLAAGSIGVRGAEAPAVSPLAGTTAGTSGPRIQFAELAYDFGRIDVGAVVKHDFVFTNTGTALLEIREVRPGCGCTTAGAWDRQVAPGQSGRIPLQFNSAGFSGSVAKSATVACNDPAQPNVALHIRGTVWRPIEVTPQTVYFNLPSEAASNETRVVRIVSNLEAPLVLSEPVCTNKAFRVELKTVKEGKEFELRVTAQTPFAANAIQAPVTLQTSATNMPVLTIPAYVSLQPAVTVMPAQIILPGGPLATAMQPSVTIRNTGTNALELSDATINLDGASVSLKPQQPGRLFTLQVSLPAGLQLQATQRVAVTLKSNHPKHPVLTVPVVQTSRAPATALARPLPVQPPPFLARPVEVPPAQQPAVR